jgi:dipeptidase D
MTLFKTAASKAVYEDPRLPEPKAVWNFFLALVETPRGSGFRDLIIPKLKEIITGINLNPIEDEVGNIIVRKPATVGCESWPGVCLQAHYGLI